MQAAQDALKYGGTAAINAVVRDLDITKQAEVDSKKIEVELAQMYDGNPYNDQVRLR